MTRPLLALAATLLAAALLSGCNTLSGMGRDLQKAGEKIEDAASGSRKK